MGAPPIIPPLMRALPRLPLTPLCALLLFPPAWAPARGAAPIRLPVSPEASLERAWEEYRAGTEKRDPQAMEAARAQLKKLRGEMGASNLDSQAMSLLRAALARSAEGDHAGAIADAAAAAELAPDLPHAQLGLARVHFAADATGVCRYLPELVRGVTAAAVDPRHARPVLAELGAALLLATVGGAICVLLALSLRRWRCFLHDFHHFFPRATASWQSATVALVLLALPTVFRLGVVPQLFAGFAALCFYLSRRERLVAGALIAAAGAVPLGAAFLTRHTAFAGTAAEEVYLLERGAWGADAISQGVAARALSGGAGFSELYALGRLELRRGQLELAVKHFQAALELRSQDPRAMTSLGNAMLAKGDAEGARAMYEQAIRADPQLPAPHFNLGKLCERRAAALSPELAPIERDRGRSELALARELDSSLADRADPPEDNLQLNRYLLHPPLPAEELAALAGAAKFGEEVRDQLALKLLGESHASWATGYPLLLAGALVALGGLGRRLGASRACERCGAAACRRCDRELVVGSSVCGECATAFLRRAACPAQLKVRKQIEGVRHGRRKERLSYALGLFCSGAGHLYLGLPVRGAAYVCLFALSAALFLFRQGLLRSAYGELPLFLRLFPPALLLLLVHLLSLRGLYKRQSG